MKKFLVCVALLAAAILLMRSEYPAMINQGAANITSSVMASQNLGTSDKGFSSLVGFLAEVALATILFIIPTSIIGGVWFAKLGYQLILDPALKEAFQLPWIFRVIFFMLSLLLFFYSFFHEWRLLTIIEEKRLSPVRKNDEARLI